MSAKGSTRDCKVSLEYHPSVNLAPLGDGVNIDCVEDTFAGLVEEVKPVSEKLSTAWSRSPRYSHVDVMV